MEDPQAEAASKMLAADQQSTGGPPPPPSPLSGCYLLIVIGEPHSPEHKEIILQKIAKGFLSWDVGTAHVDLEKELQALTSQAPEGEEARNGERLIQYATENLVTEVLIHPQLNTLLQCIRNLLSSFTRHRHLIHAGYTFAGNGSWILQDGTFSLADFIDAFQETEVQRVLRAYENSVTVDVHCSPEGDWSTERLSKELFSRTCKVRVNPDDRLTAGGTPIGNFMNYISPFLRPASIEQLLEPSDVVGNIRFSHPTLYVFPGGQGDAALFGINGFNMLVDGGFARKACFWDFARHLDRLDAVLITRLNNGNINGIAAVLRRKKQSHVYPQIGHFFCNLQERRHCTSPDGDKDRDPLLLNLADEGHEMVLNLRHMQLRPHPCYRDGSHIDPVNLYHKVGHGKLDMYIISPARDSREVKEFLAKWNSNDPRLFSSLGKKDINKEFHFPLQNLTSICALLVWQPANPSDTITRILFPGSTPQHKIFEGLDKLRNLEFLKFPVCSARSLSPSASTVGLSSRASSKPRSAPAVIDKLLPGEGVKAPPRTSSVETNKQAHAPKAATIPMASMTEVKQTKPATPLSSTPVPVTKTSQPLTKPKAEKITSKHEPTKPKTEIIKSLEGEKISAKTEKATRTSVEVTKTKVEHKAKVETKTSISKTRTDSKPPRSVERKTQKTTTTSTVEKKSDAKSSPTTPKKSIEAKVNGVATKAETAKATRTSSRTRPSPTATPAKSTKEANNRKVVESKYHVSRISSTTRTAATKATKKESQETTTKTERKPISRRPKTGSPSKPPAASRPPGSPAKSSSAKSTPTPSVKSDKDGVVRKTKGEAEKITTDSSAVSTPSTVDPETAALRAKGMDADDKVPLLINGDLTKEEKTVVQEIEDAIAAEEITSVTEEKVEATESITTAESTVEEIEEVKEEEETVTGETKGEEKEEIKLEDLAEGAEVTAEEHEGEVEKESEVAEEHEEVHAEKQLLQEKDELEATEEEQTEDIEEGEQIDVKQSLQAELELEAKQEEQDLTEGKEEDEDDEEEEYLIIEKEEVEESVQEQESLESHIPEEAGVHEIETEEEEGELQKHLRDEVESEKRKKEIVAEKDEIKVNGIKDYEEEEEAEEEVEIKDIDTKIIETKEVLVTKKQETTPESDKEVPEKESKEAVVSKEHVEERKPTTPEQEAKEEIPSTILELELARAEGLTLESKEQLEEEVQEIITSAKEIVTKSKFEVERKPKDTETEPEYAKTDRLKEGSSEEKKETEDVEDLKEASSTSPEEKLDISFEKNREVTDDTRDTDQKLEEEHDEGIEVKETGSRDVIDQRYPAEESQPDEKFSTTIESAATTAPTLPEDERIPLDEIKEIVEEKHVKEETKEKEKPVEVIPRLEQPTTLPQVVIPAGIGIFDPHVPHVIMHQRDIVKTPDEVADLPVHEEVDPGMYESDEFARDFQKPKDDIVSFKKQQELQDSRQQSPELDIKGELHLKYEEAAKVHDKKESDTKEHPVLDTQVKTKEEVCTKPEPKVSEVDIDKQQPVIATTIETEQKVTEKITEEVTDSDIKKQALAISVEEKDQEVTDKLAAESKNVLDIDIKDSDKKVAEFDALDQHKPALEKDDDIDVDDKKVKDERKLQDDKTTEEGKKLEVEDITKSEIIDIESKDRDTEKEILGQCTITLDLKEEAKQVTEHFLEAEISSIKAETVPVERKEKIFDDTVVIEEGIRDHQKDNEDVITKQEIKPITTDEEQVSKPSDIQKEERETKVSKFDEKLLPTLFSGFVEVMAETVLDSKTVSAKAVDIEDRQDITDNLELEVEDKTQIVVAMLENIDKESVEVVSKTIPKGEGTSEPEILEASSALSATYLEIIEKLQQDTQNVDFPITKSDAPSIQQKEVDEEALKSGDKMDSVEELEFKIIDKLHIADDFKDIKEELEVQKEDEKASVVKKVEDLMKVTEKELIKTKVVLEEAVPDMVEEPSILDQESSAIVEENAPPKDEVKPLTSEVKEEPVIQEKVKTEAGEIPHYLDEKEPSKSIEQLKPIIKPEEIVSKIETEQPTKAHDLKEQIIEDDLTKKVDKELHAVDEKEPSKEDKEEDILKVEKEHLKAESEEPSIVEGQEPVAEKKEYLEMEVAEEVEFIKVERKDSNVVEGKQLPEVAEKQSALFEDKEPAKVEEKEAAKVEKEEPLKVEKEEPAKAEEEESPKAEEEGPAKGEEEESAKVEEKEPTKAEAKETMAEEKEPIKVDKEEPAKTEEKESAEIVEPAKFEEKEPTKAEKEELTKAEEKEPTKTGDEPEKVEEKELTTLQEKEPIVVEKKEPSEVEEKEPTVAEQKEPSIVKEKEPSKAEEKESSKVEEKEPAMAEEKEPSKVEEKEPTMAEEKETAKVEEKELTVAEEIEPVKVKEKEPIMAEEKGPSEVEEKEPIMAEEKEPAKVEDKEPTMAEEKEHSKVEEKESIMVEEEEPSKFEEKEPIMAQEKEPSKVDGKEPTMAEEKEPAKVKEKEPTIAEEEEPSKIKEKEPTMAEDKEPSQVDRKEPTMAEEKEPSKVYEKEPAMVEEKETVKVEEKELIMAEEKEPAKVEEKEPTMAEEKEPAKVEDATELKEEPVKVDEKEPTKAEEKEIAKVEGKEPSKAAEKEPVNEKGPTKVEEEEPAKVVEEPVIVEKKDSAQVETKELTKIEEKEPSMVEEEPIMALKKDSAQVEGNAPSKMEKREATEVEEQETFKVEEQETFKVEEKEVEQQEPVKEDGKEPTEAEEIEPTKAGKGESTKIDEEEEEEPTQAGDKEHAKPEGKEPTKGEEEKYVKVEEEEEPTEEEKVGKEEHIEVEGKESTKLVEKESAKVEVKVKESAPTNVEIMGEEKLAESEEKDPAKLEQKESYKDKEEKEPAKAKEKETTEVNQEEPEKEKSLAELEKKSPAQVELKVPAKIEEQEIIEVEKIEPAKVELKEPIKMQEEELAKFEEKETVIMKKESAQVEEKRSTTMEEKESTDIEEKEPSKVDQDQLIKEDGKEFAEVEDKEPVKLGEEEVIKPEEKEMGVKDHTKDEEQECAKIEEKELGKVEVKKPGKKEETIKETLKELTKTEDIETTQVEKSESAKMEGKEPTKVAEKVPTKLEGEKEPLTTGDKESTVMEDAKPIKSEESLKTEIIKVSEREPVTHESTTTKVEEKLMTKVEGKESPQVIEKDDFKLEGAKFTKIEHEHPHEEIDIESEDDHMGEDAGDGEPPPSPGEEYIDSGLEEEPVYAKLEAPEHPEYVTVTPDSTPASPKALPGFKPIGKSQEDDVTIKVAITETKPLPHEIDTIEGVKDIKKESVSVTTDTKTSKVLKELRSQEDKAETTLEQKYTTYEPTKSIQSTLETLKTTHETIPVVSDVSKDKIPTTPLETSSVSIADQSTPPKLPVDAIQEEDKLHSYEHAKRPSTDTTNEVDEAVSSKIADDITDQENAIDDVISSTEKAITSVTKQLTTQVEQFLVTEKKVEETSRVEVQEVISTPPDSTVSLTAHSADKSEEKDLTFVSEKETTVEKLTIAEVDENHKLESTITETTLAKHIIEDHSDTEQNSDLEKRSMIISSKESIVDKISSNAISTSTVTSSVISTIGSTASYLAGSMKDITSSLYDNTTEEKADVESSEKEIISAGKITKEDVSTITSTTAKATDSSIEREATSSMVEKISSAITSTSAIATTVSSSVVTTSSITKAITSEKEKLAQTTENDASTVITSTTTTLLSEKEAKQDVEEKEAYDSDTTISTTVRRMVVTASSEDGGTEIELCPTGSITFTSASSTYDTDSVDKDYEVPSTEKVISSISSEIQQSSSTVQTSSVSSTEKEISSKETEIITSTIAGVGTIQSAQDIKDAARIDTEPVIEKVSAKTVTTVQKIGDTNGDLYPSDHDVQTSGDEEVVDGKIVTRRTTKTTTRRIIRTIGEGVEGSESDDDHKDSVTEETVTGDDGRIVTRKVTRRYITVIKKEGESDEDDKSPAGSVIMDDGSGSPKITKTTTYRTVIRKGDGTVGDVEGEAEEYSEGSDGGTVTTKTTTTTTTVMKKLSADDGDEEVTTATTEEVMTGDGASKSITITTQDIHGDISVKTITEPIEAKGDTLVGSSKCTDETILKGALCEVISSAEKLSKEIMEETTSKQILEKDSKIEKSTTGKVVTNGEVHDKVTVSDKSKEVTTPFTATVTTVVSKDIVELENEATKLHDDALASSSSVLGGAVATVRKEASEFTRSTTPGSDVMSDRDLDLGGPSTPHSDISSGQVSRAATNIWEGSEGRPDSRHCDSDEEEDGPVSPMSVTSQVAHSPPSSHFDFEMGDPHETTSEVKHSTKTSVGDDYSKHTPETHKETKQTISSSMTSSFYGSLPPDPLQQLLEEQKQRNGSGILAKSDKTFMSSSYISEPEDKESKDSFSKDHTFSALASDRSHKEEKASSSVDPSSYEHFTSEQQMGADESLDFERALYEHRATRGEDLAASSSPTTTYHYETKHSESKGSPSRIVKYEHHYSSSGMNGQRLSGEHSLREFTEDYGNGNIAGAKQYEDLMNRNRDIEHVLEEKYNGKATEDFTKFDMPIAAGYRQEVFTTSSKITGVDATKLPNGAEEKKKTITTTTVTTSSSGMEHDPMFHHQFPTPSVVGQAYPEPPQGFGHPPASKAEAKKDPIEGWGKPLGLPAPAPPPTNNAQGDIVTMTNTNKTTPKKEKKVMQIKKSMIINENNKTSGGQTGKDAKTKSPESPIKQKGGSNKEGGRNAKCPGNPIYVDLTYVPHHGNSYYSSLEFFKKVRARYYVFSGTEPSREVYNALLEAKQTWEDKELEVTIIPTYDTDTLGYWVAENEDILAKCKIDLSPSASRCTINLQDHETSCSAYRLEF